MPLPVLIPIALSAISVGANIAQGVQARKQVRAAERAADDALASAKRKLAVDRFEGLQIPMEAYEMAQQAGVAQQKQALTALQEAGPRGLASGVGRVSAAGLQAAEQQRQQMAQDMFALEKLQAEEEAKRDKALASVDFGVVEGAQAAALAAEQQAAAAFSGALQTAAGAGMDLYEASSLYGTDFTGAQVKKALDKGIITQNQVGDYTKYIESISRPELRGMSEAQLAEGFKLALNPYGYDPATGRGMSLGTPKQMSVDSVGDFGYEFLGE